MPTIPFPGDARPPEKVIGHTEMDGSTIIDTCFMADGFQPFETAIKCPAYQNDKFVVVEAYATREEAEKGHNKWVGIMASDKQPEKLIDCVNDIITMLATLGESTEYPRQF